MSDVFFEELGLPQPGINLGIGGGTHGQQTGRALEACEALFLAERPDLVIVCGDVNATPAAALAAVKLGIPAAHLEAGLRSFDRTMPEEINRLVTDVICDYLWTPSPDADENLAREGVAREKIHLVGNIMIDTLCMLRPRIETAGTRDRFGLSERGYALVTLHRPSNVDNRERLEELYSVIEDCAREKSLVFPLHPRTKIRLEEFGLLERIKANPRIIVSDPLPYIAFMNLVSGCAAVITDSGGVQEETSYLGIPCLTLRDNTERPVTITQGTNRLVQASALRQCYTEALQTPVRPAHIPFWDGGAARRVISCVKEIFGIE
jgi:UDP-N-acetylglucosamine 2-epimerase (non-hydrolysing)